MENNNKTKLIWAAVIIVSAAGLMITTKNKNNPVAPVETKTASVTEGPTNTSMEIQSTASGKVSKTITTGKKPSGNVVELTSQGFKPFILQVKKGESVEFLNSSDKAMVIRSHDQKPENFYPGFSQESGPLGKGGRFYFTFTTVGDWSYYNLNSKNDEGVIIVR